MSFMSIDKKKCTGTGICVAECPRLIIKLKDKDPIAYPVEGAEELCIHCGHCVAVCPHGAVSLSFMKTDDCPVIDRKKLPDPVGIEHILRSRRSIRTYSDKDIDRDTLKDLIHVARYAPTGMNRQDAEWIAVTSKAKVRELAGMVIDWMRAMVEKNDPIAVSYNMQAMINAFDSGKDPICRGAAGLVVTHASEKFSSGPADCMIALSFLDIAAPSFGLGTCWAGFFMSGMKNWLPLREALSIPEGNIPVGAMMIGYPKYRYQRLPLRNEPKISWV
ncbi:MAG: nitroreductase family protein [Nitrospirota bacterium]|nr:MAG: nitroreductase family protein [Nitrospirota bacterium]